jgi:PAS domain S-box-containing protein
MILPLIRRSLAKVLDRISLGTVLNILAHKVEERTAELSQINRLLETEIAQRRLIEANLAESEARLQDILDTANASIILMRVTPVDAHPEIIYLSRGHEAVFGYSPEETINIKGLWRSRIHPEDLSKIFFNQVQKICALGSTVLEYRFYHRDGKMRWISDNIVSRWDETAQCWLVTAVAIDITDRKLAEAERLSQQVFLRQIIDLVPAAIFVKDREGRYLTVNQTTANRYGTTVEAMKGKTAKDFNPCTEEIIDYEINNQEVMETRSPKIIPSRLSWNRVGEPVWNQVIVSPFIDSQGEVQGVVGISIDVTSIKQVEKELRQAKEAAEAANQAKSLFLAKMSHELRTPLNAILGFSKIMQPNANLTPEQKQNLAIICHSGEYLLNLINQVLDLSKIESHKITINYQKCDIYALLKEVEEMFSLKAQHRGLWLTCSYTLDMPQYIYTDPTKLRQILINLLSNGLKFTKVGGVSLLVDYQPKCNLPNYRNNPDNPNDLDNTDDSESIINIKKDYGSEGNNSRLEVLDDVPNFHSFSDDEANGDLDSSLDGSLDHNLTGSGLRVDDELLSMVGNIVFRITDTGVGIDPQEFTLLFQPFSQTSSGQQMQEGTGLGLHLSQQFVNLLGGEMTVSSQVGQGSTFKFNLPHFSRVLSTTISPVQPVDNIDLLNNSLDNLLNNLSDNFVSNSLSDNSVSDSLTDSSTDLDNALLEKPLEKLLSNDTLNKADNASHNSSRRFTSNNIGYYGGDFSTRNILGSIPLFNYSLPDLVSENIPPLSSNWLLNFQRSIVQGDIIVMRSLTQEISLSHPLLYQTLSHLTDEYKLEQLLDLAQALDAYTR